MVRGDTNWLREASHGATRGSSCPCVSLLELRSRVFDFSNTQPDQTQTVVLTPATCVEALRELVVVARVHALDVGTASLRVVAVAAAPTAWQPALDYVSDAELASLELSGPAGTLLRAAVQPPLPTHVQLRLVATMPTSPPPTVTATLSIAIEGKS